MNRQVLNLARSVLVPRVPIKNLARNSSAYKPPASWYDFTINELPVPQGSWKAAYDAQQRKNNMHLIVGTSFFLFTLVVIKQSGLVYFNATIPKLPELGE